MNEKDENQDFREVVITRDRMRMRQTNQNAPSDWEKKWNNSKNILEKTMIYELSPQCGHVESYDEVKDIAFKNYSKEAKEIFTSADIMNGWWYCFKYIFLKDRNRIGRFSEEAVSIKSTVYNLVKGKEQEEAISALCKKEYTDNEALCISFMEYLKVVYTIGNLILTPPKVYYFRDFLDSWEYKWNKYKSERDGLFLEDYPINDKGEMKVFYKDKTDFDGNIDNLIEYMNDRRNKIISRGKSIRECMVE